VLHADQAHMQAHCRRTLDGDLSLLEQITRERRVRA
jgi:hypothetical protein